MISNTNINPNTQSLSRINNEEVQRSVRANNQRPSNLIQENNINNNIINNNNQRIHPIDVLTNRNLIQDNMNISINEEFSSRRNNIVSNNNNINIYPSNNIPVTLRNLVEVEGERVQYCSLCDRTYFTMIEYQQHFSTCGGFRNNQIMHNSINEILHLVHTLNRQLQVDNPFTLLNILGQEEPEEATEYIDWTYIRTEDGSVIWKNRGKAILTKEEMNKIATKNSNLIKNETYYKKRIWLLKQINNKIYDKSGANTTLVVSRDNVLEESFNQFMTTFELDLKKAMQIFFVDEVAHDVGGVYREWYTILFDSIFSPIQNFFTQVDERCLGKNTFFIPITPPKVYSQNCNEYYEFIGKVIGKAIFDKITIKSNFNLILIKHLLKMKIDIEDLKLLDNGVIYFFLIYSTICL